MARKCTTAQPSGYTILVVDDQEEALISTRLLLERKGHHVLTAASGEEALALFRHQQVHLVIIDYFMPGMSGEVVVQEIRKMDEDVQILLQTGYSGEKPPWEMLRILDIQGYHDKSEGPDRLLLWVGVVLKAVAHLKQVREMEQEMAKSHAQLHWLSARLTRLQKEEPERGSRELHDQLGQLLATIGMDVGWVWDHCAEETSLVRERLQEAAQLVQEALSLVGLQEQDRRVRGEREGRSALGAGTCVGLDVTTAEEEHSADDRESVLL
jgi:CheY-like chemotaxis protein